MPDGTNENTKSITNDSPNSANNLTPPLPELTHKDEPFEIFDLPRPGTPRPVVGVVRGEQRLPDVIIEEEVFQAFDLPRPGTPRIVTNVVKGTIRLPDVLFDQD